jgi:hypothetical protein
VEHPRHAGGVPRADEDGPEPGPREEATTEAIGHRR